MKEHRIIVTRDRVRKTRDVVCLWTDRTAVEYDDSARAFTRSERDKYGDDFEIMGWRLFLCLFGSVPEPGSKAVYATRKEGGSQ